MRRAALIPTICLIGVAAACTPPPVDPARVAAQCEERARAAAGPTGSVTVGANSRTGAYSGFEVGITSDYLAGRDPAEVYAQCYFARTGSYPATPPSLR